MKHINSYSQNSDPEMIGAKLAANFAGKPMTGDESLYSKMKLKNLPESDRQLVIEWLRTAGEKECLHRIRVGMGFEVSRATLYRALEDWKQEAELANCEATARHRVEVESILASKELTAEEIDDQMDRQFLKMAVEGENLNKYVQICRLQIARQSARDRRRIAEAKLELQRERQALEREKHEWRKAETARKAKEACEKENFSNHETIAEMRKRALEEAERRDAEIGARMKVLEAEGFKGDPLVTALNDPRPFEEVCPNGIAGEPPRVESQRPKPDLCPVEEELEIASVS